MELAFPFPISHSVGWLRLYPPHRPLIDPRPNRPLHNVTKIQKQKESDSSPSERERKSQEKIEKKTNSGKGKEKKS